MSDIFTPEKRSKIMSSIHSKNTKIEKLIDSWLRKNKIKFKKHYNILGNPDFVIPEKKIAIFVDGDFWHGYRMGPKNLSKRSDYWRNKITENKRRDKKVNKELKKIGWSVVRIWEHEILRN